MAASKRNNNKRSGSNAGTVFWLGAILIALFVFALNWGKIQDTLKRTNFHDIVKTQTGKDAPPAAPVAAPEEPKPAAKDAPAKAAPKAEPQAKVQPEPALPENPVPKAEPPAAKADPQPEGAGATPKGAAQPQQPGKQQSPNAAKGAPSASGGAASAAPASRLRSAALYFVRIDDDGNISRQEVKRQIPVSDSPLLDSLGALLKGPNDEELRHKLVSLVPQGTKLLSAQVRGTTAVLNFNEAFMYNHYGIEGYAGQLKQVVFTATAFPNVQEVQILIEGEKHDYLGGEGVYIGKPLSRSSF